MGGGAGIGEFKNTKGGETHNNKIPQNSSQEKHIFRDKAGHLPDTPKNRALLERVASDQNNFLGKDQYGNNWYAENQSDGSQIWVESRNGKIIDGGSNLAPKQWNDATGLKNSIP